MDDEIQAAITDLAEKRILANQARVVMEKARDEDRKAMSEAESAQNKLNALIQGKVNSVVRSRI